MEGEGERERERERERFNYLPISDSETVYIKMGPLKPLKSPWIRLKEGKSKAYFK
jgi:hypothetical protein